MNSPLVLGRATTPESQEVEVDLVAVLMMKGGCGSVPLSGLDMCVLLLPLYFHCLPLCQ